MSDGTITRTALPLTAPPPPSVEIDSSNFEKDKEGFLGDRASKGAFRDVLDKWRKSPRKSGDDPLRKGPSEKISKKERDAVMIGDEAERPSCSRPPHAGAHDCTAVIKG
jgi:hypothetical protein